MQEKQISAINAANSFLFGEGSEEVIVPILARIKLCAFGRNKNPCGESTGGSWKFPRPSTAIHVHIHPRDAR